MYKKNCLKRCKLRTAPAEEQKRGLQTQEINLNQKNRYEPTSAPRPFNPTIKTLADWRRFKVSLPMAWIKRLYMLSYWRSCSDPEGYKRWGNKNETENTKKQGTGIVHADLRHHRKKVRKRKNSTLEAMASSLSFCFLRGGSCINQQQRYRYGFAPDLGTDGRSGGGETRNNRKK
jgi:hypothetical protein